MICRTAVREDLYAKKVEERTTTSEIAERNHRCPRSPALVFSSKADDFASIFRRGKVEVNEEVYARCSIAEVLNLKC